MISKKCHEALKSLWGFFAHNVNKIKGLRHRRKEYFSFQQIVPNYDEYAKLQKITFCSHEIMIPKWEEGQKRYITETFGGLNRKLKILDVACGDGVGLRCFKQLGFNNVSGVEFNDEKIPKAKESGYPVYRLDMHDLCKFKDNEFDVIYSSHTLEHAYWPEKVIREFQRILKFGGKLYVVLPYPDCSDVNNKAHGGKFELGTNVLDDGKKVIKFFCSRDFMLVKKKYDNFREDEIWLEFFKKNNKQSLIETLSSLLRPKKQ